MTPVTIIVMYHYVRGREGPASGIVPLSPDEFEEQLDALQRIGSVVSPSVLPDSSPGEGGVRFVLTFDDGTRDHFTEAFHRLQRRGLSGLFAVLSGPSLEGYVPTFHLVHAMISQLGVEALWQEMKQVFGEERLGSVEQAALTYPRENTEVRRRTKFALNYALPAAAVREFLLGLFVQAGRSLDAFRTDSYVSDDEILVMAKGGMEFAIHGHRHEPWSGDVERFIAREIDPCRDWLDSLLGYRSQQYILPFGGKSAHEVNIASAEASLRARGIRCAHLSQPGINQNGAFWYRRFDCADLPPLKPWPSAIAELTDSL